MKGEFIIVDGMIDNSYLTLGDLTHIMIGQQLNNNDHNIGWYARRYDPISHGFRYIWNEDTTELTYGHLKRLELDGWELAYKLTY